MVNYPNGMKKNFSKPVTQSHDTRHRGYSLEEELNASNEFYLAFDKAVIHKKPTPRDKGLSSDDATKLARRACFVVLV